MEPQEDSAAAPRGRGMRIAGKVAYWLAVLIVSLAIVFLLILLLESRDNSSVNGVVRSLARV